MLDAQVGIGIRIRSAIPFNSLVGSQLTRTRGKGAPAEVPEQRVIRVPGKRPPVTCRGWLRFNGATLRPAQGGAPIQTGELYPAAKSNCNQHLNSNFERGLGVHSMRIVRRGRKRDLAKLFVL
jgi:hypothetical protein